MVECRVISLVANTCGVREDHSQRDRSVGVVRVADRETDQIANVVIERNDALIDKLHQRRCGK